MIIITDLKYERQEDIQGDVCRFYSYDSIHDQIPYDVSLQDTMHIQQIEVRSFDFAYYDKNRNLQKIKLALSPDIEHFLKLPLDAINSLNDEIKRKEREIENVLINLDYEKKYKRKVEEELNSIKNRNFFDKVKSLFKGEK